ncbi:four-carbon acid sugar kinase family protein [Bacillus sp. PS06]|uniref:four-carbon acid sugar kinase family protein n=1 Tax=Bacillus sp. PS06 TaxID=2764176 RepID=UPI00177F40EE|nr:four-carbon acid sugar kinase family protein [Bacillus sp. PS06]MBD8071152.1 four-carbon acid sugar kinase family protein [Bacillus sp. PS06]
MTTEKLGIIADDLTGSNDSGVQLAKKGLRSSVIFDLNPSAVNVDNDVVVIDTDSRAILAKESYERSRKAASFLKEHGFTQIYKKVDSTLRGNLGPEIQAVVDVFEPEFCIIAPAFPRIGRTTKDGIHYLQGTAIANTEISKDPKCPVKESSIKKLIEGQVDVQVGQINTKELGLDLEAWKKELARFKEQGVSWLVFDAEEDVHLEWIAASISTITTNVVWVGSAGLAEYLPENLAMNRHEESAAISVREEHVLVVSGSLSAITKTQIDRLLDMDGMQAVEVDPLHVFENSARWEELKQLYIEKMVSIYEQGQNVVLYVDSSLENREKSAARGKELALSPSEISDKISKGLGEIASEVVKNNAIVSGLVLTGGDTAKDVCRYLGSSGLTLLKEVEPGIPLGKLSGQYELYAITKAGAFGTENSLVHAVQELKGVN